MSLRIIAGEAKGRRLQVPEGTDVRPSTARVREAVFNSLQSLGILQGACVLDLFSGSGALGLEALSRGAAAATFVESSPVALDALRANISAVGYTKRCQVIAADVLGEWVNLASFSSGDVRSQMPLFDLALCDPPYSFNRWSELLADLSASVLMAESDRAIELGAQWDIFKSARYAGTVVVIAKRR